MDSKFNPPATKEEFVERAKKINGINGAMGVLNALRNRRASMVRAVDIEIAFYEEAVNYLKTGETKWGEEDVS
jgi:hypothetical protein